MHKNTLSDKFKAALPFALPVLAKQSKSELRSLVLGCQLGTPVHRRDCFDVL